MSDKSKRIPIKEYNNNTFEKLEFEIIKFYFIKIMRFRGKLINLQ
jgi:hypothetical protein